MALAKSGAGKSNIIRALRLVPKNARAIFFDPARDHKTGTEYRDSVPDFLRLLESKNASGKPFRIGYDGKRSVEVFEIICAAVWSILDGRKETFFIVEELARVSDSPFMASHYADNLISEGRKYGLVFIATSQRPQRIAKDVYENCTRWLVGQQQGLNVRKMADDIGVPVEVVRQLQPMEFLDFRDDPGQEPKRIKVPYVKP